MKSQIPEKLIETNKSPTFEDRVGEKKLINVFAVGVTNEYCVEILQSLLERNYKIKCLSTSKNNGYWPSSLDNFLKKNNSKVLLSEDFYLPERFMKILDPDYSIFSLDIFSELAYYEKMFLLTTDRHSFWPISQIARCRLFYRYIGHFYKIIKQENIETLLVFCFPHGITDIALFGLAKVIKLKVIYVDWPGLSTSFATIETEIKTRRVYSKTDLTLNTNCERPKTNHADRFMLEAMAPPVWGSLKSKNRLLILLRTLIGLILRAPFGKYYNSSAFFLNVGPRKRLSYVIPLIRYYLNTKRIINFYNQHAQVELKEKNYLVFFLHLQPESTTMPQSGIFADQLLALDLILQALPEGVTVYVKEHPLMFLKFAEDTHERSIEFYSHMLKDPRVSLVDMSVDSLKLAKHATFVASINGTISWEVMRSGKPCIIFGWAWFSSCESCYVVDSVNTLKDAFVGASAKNSDEVLSDVHSFMKDFSTKIVDAVPNQFALSLMNTDFDRKQSVKNLSHAIDVEINSSGGS